MSCQPPCPSEAKCACFSCELLFCYEHGNYHYNQTKHEVSIVDENKISIISKSNQDKILKKEIKQRVINTSGKSFNILSNIKKLAHREIQKLKKVQNLNDLESINIKFEDYFCYLVQEGIIKPGIYSIRKDNVENLTSSFENKYSGSDSLKNIINYIEKEKEKIQVFPDLIQRNIIFEQLKESNRRLELEKKFFADQFLEFVKNLDEKERDLENLIKIFAGLKHAYEALKDIKILKDIEAQFEGKELMESMNQVINEDTLNQSNDISIKSQELSILSDFDPIKPDDSMKCLKCDKPTKNILEDCNHFMCLDCLNSQGVCQCRNQNKITFLNYCENCEKNQICLTTRNCGHQSCFDCITSMSECKKCTELKNTIKTKICSNCKSEKKFIKIKHCQHKHCQTCYKIYNECSVCYKSQGLCKFCLNKKENTKMGCGHSSCEDCKKNDICFSCLLTTNLKNIRYVESINCEVCHINTNNYIMAKCNHYLCQKCFIKTKNLDFKCYSCSINNLLDSICILCGNNSKYALENQNMVKILCCDTTICKICLEFIDGVCKKCNPNKRASSSHRPFYKKIFH